MLHSLKKKTNKQCNYRTKGEPSETKISSPEAIKLYGPHHGWGYKPRIIWFSISLIHKN